MNGLASQIRSMKYVNTSDADIAAAFLTDSSKPAVVTWKPLVAQVLKAKDAKVIFDSSKIPGEILDLLVTRTDILNRADGSGQKFAKAITGAWYEVMGQMSAPANDKVLTYKEQLSTTQMFYTPQSAVQVTTSPNLRKTMNLVREFTFAHGLLGDKTKSVDDVAIQLPDGTVLGRQDRIRLRFSTTFMQLAEQGKL
jgi:NitT/TauT family transport system substrate-binding protein